MSDDEWIKKGEAGRKVKFVYQVLPEDGASAALPLDRSRCLLQLFHLVDHAIRCEEAIAGISPSAFQKIC
jgi:hypothetical protein